MVPVLWFRRGTRHGGKCDQRRSVSGASKITTQNSSQDEWDWGRQPVVNQPSSPLPPEPRRQQLVAVLAVEQLSRHCRQPPSGVLGAGDVLRVGCVQCLHHLDAEVVMLADEVGGNLLGGAAEKALGRC